MYMWVNGNILNRNLTKRIMRSQEWWQALIGDFGSF